MAKIPKLKKPTKPASAHSRASRRASCSSINLDKSLASIPLPSRKNNIIYAHTNGGVTKPKKKDGRVLKRKQRQRLEQGRGKAEDVVAKLERKLATSGKRWEERKGRNAKWEELNEKIEMKKRKTLKLLDRTGDQGQLEWENEAMDDDTDDARVAHETEVLQAKGREHDRAYDFDENPGVEEDIL